MTVSQQALSQAKSSQSMPLDLPMETPVHFIGVGGIGMSGLARVMAELGYPVSGSDLAANDSTRMLQTLSGVAAPPVIHQGHAAQQVPAGAVVIVSTSIDESNPEIVQARSQGSPIYHRSQLLRFVVAKHDRSIGVTGTHGKTTTTGMVATALMAAGLKPTVVVGGKLPGLGANALLGENLAVAVAELDESDGTLVQYQPTLSLVANLELDHADHFADGLAGILRNVETFLRQLPAGAVVVYNRACPNTAALTDRLGDLPVRYVALFPGEPGAGDMPAGQDVYWLKNIREHGLGCFQGYVYKNRQLLGEIHLNVPGQFNLVNALGALALGDLLHAADFEEMAEGLRDFRGMGRRFERVGEYNQARLVDDYAHHPTEVKATLEAARQMLNQQNSGRLIAVFQPHRYTRLKALWEEFSACFAAADEVLVTDVYEASEEPIEGISGQAFARAMPHLAATYVPAGQNFQALRQAVRDRAQPGDMIISLGAGSITHLLRGWEKA
ncbi:MAG: UDP-N-acetylmuramate--L-alanine ligase [Candidatus Melainabacteria bacterium]